MGVLSLFLVAGAGVDVLVLTVVLPLVLPTAQSVEATAVFANRELSPRLSPNPVQVCSTLPAILNGGKILELRFKQHREKAFT